MDEAGINVGRETERGRLKLWTRDKWRQPGELESERKARQVHQFIDEATQAGFKGIRFAVEMTWTLGPHIKAAQLEHWEATINTLFTPDFPGRIICQYNRSRLAADVMLAALHTHPSVIMGDDVYPNFFYQAPLILSGNGSGNGNGNGHNIAATQVEWMISQLKRSRVAEQERAKLLQRHAGAEARERLAAIVESSDDAIIGKDLAGIISSWNSAAERLYGYKAEEVIGQSVCILIPPDRREEEVMFLAKLRRGERIQHFETIRIAKDGRRIDVSLTVSPILDERGKVIGASKTARDISERKKIEAELHAWQLELENRVAKRTVELTTAHTRLQAEIEERKRLESEIAQAIEREQLRLGQELHDGLGQELTGIAYHMSALGVRLAKVAPTHTRDLKKLELMIRQGVEQTRNLAREFHPVDLQARGLPSALRQLASRTKELFGVSCVAESEKIPNVILNGPVAIQLFRIAQEAVHNAIKHAKAKHIVIRLVKAESNIRLTIEDDGVGLPANVNESQGMGLRIMQHRAGLIGAKMDFGNGSSKGALITCSVPDQKWLVPFPKEAADAEEESVAASS